MVEQAILTCDALGETSVVRLAGVEAMNELPRWTVDVLSNDGALDPAGALGAPAGLALADGGGGTRAVSLLVTEARYLGHHRDGHRYAVELSAAVAPLGLRRGHRVFQDKTTQELVDQVLRDAGVQTSEIAWRLGGRYGRRVYTVQYGETEWAFVRRLLADEGINFWFDYDDEGAALLVFGDGPSSHASIDGEPTVRYEDPSGRMGTAGTLVALELTHELACDRAQVRDFDVRHPDVPIDATEGDGPLAFYEYPASVLDAEAAAARAKVRLEQLQRLAQRVDAESLCVRLAPGRVVRIAGGMDDLFAGEFLIVRVKHELTQSSRNVVEGSRPYMNRALLVPFGERAFRPDLPARAPRVDGIETATVTGPSGEEIHVDDLGSIKVRFPWDRSGIGDDRSSRWARTMQMPMHGSMLLPRVGWEVPVVYFDGDPDRPLVLGRVYNGGAPVPYGQPGKKATTTLQSATSPGGGSTHEIRFADDGGAMEAFIHATKDQSVKVGGTNTVTVSANETHDVKKSMVLAITGSQTATIGASQTVTVGGDAGLTVKGSRTESIGALESIGVTGSYNLICKGAYSEVVGGLYGLECNLSNTTVQGSFTQTVAGPMLLTAGLGTNNSVAAARLEDVAGARSFTSLGAYADSVVGVKKVTAGASSDTAGTHVATNVKGLGSVSVGGTASMTAGGPLVVEAAAITVKVGGSLKAKAGGVLALGGKVKVSGGTAKFDASKTLKKSTSKVG